MPREVAVVDMAEEGVAAEEAVEEQMEKEQPAKKKATKNELVERKTIGNENDTEEKLAIMLRLNEERGNGKLAYNAKQFVNKYLKPTMYCLETHCGGDVEVFARKYPKYSHTTFEKCCGGTGSVCTPKEKK